MEYSTRKIRVVVADDSRIALRAVCAYLDFDGQFEIVGTANDGRSVMRQAESLCPDLVLTDSRMPRMTGLEAAKQLRKSVPEVRVLILAEMSGELFSEQCLEVGVDGFVKKSQMPEKLMEEVRRLFPENPISRAELSRE